MQRVHDSAPGACMCCGTTGRAGHWMTQAAQGRAQGTGLKGDKGVAFEELLK
jgi:hypothetical protein